MTEPWQESYQILRRMQDQVDRAKAEAPSRDDAAEPAVGAADTLGGMVHVEVRGTEVSELRIDPRAMHRTAEELAAAIVEATNAAFANLQAAMTADLPEPPQLDQVSRTLEEIATDSARALGQATEGMRQSMAAVERISALHRRQR